MCGIAGVVDGSGALLDEDAVIAMRDVMRARGPDDEGLFSDGTAMLAFRRLSILDLAGGHQPMSLPVADGALTLVFNGEIYNFAELRDRLKALGSTFSTRSDTEVILHAYRQWGPAAVRELDGMFALALWDAPRRRLYLARDRFGKKPLYFWRLRNRIAFASTLTALLQHPGVPRVLDDEAVAEYLALEYVVAPRTILAGVEKLPPATQLILDAESGRVTAERYWELRVDGAANRLSPAEATAELTRRLTLAVRRRLVADVPLGIFLSGGVDSSTVAALAAREHAGIETFSVRFADPSFDESRYARAVAAHLGTRHHEEELSLDEAAGIVGQLGEILDEPIADGSIVPTYLLSRFARRHVTVALGGDGGDELFAGYPTYVAQRLETMVKPLLRPSLVRVMRALAERLPVSHDNFSFEFKLKKLLSGLDAPDDIRNVVWLGAFDRARLERLLYRQLDDLYRPAYERYREPARGTHLERVLYQDIGLYLCHSVLAKVDRASMAASLEVRAPLLDTAVAELAASLPMKMKLHGLQGKWILKQVARPLLPAEIIARKKKGFGMPIGKWLRGQLQPLLRDALLDGNSLATLGRLDRRVIEQLIAEHSAGRRDHRQKLWALLVLELWQRKNLAQAIRSAADRRRASTR
jgi:asparagine synthase (glutamine-hydrolysing)